LSLREHVFAELKELGFRPAGSLPDPDASQSPRPTEEIAGRLMSLDALFTWVAFSEEDVTTDRIEAYLNRNGLRSWLTAEESEILALTRKAAHEAHVDTIGWKLENMWSLAWVLGFEPPPSVESSQIRADISRSLIYEFLPGLERTIADLIARSTLRADEVLIAMEYRFYCAHNAVRSAQLGRDTVPRGFHPVYHGGAVHERRHSLTWCLSPSVSWQDTDLST
jgi:hypothetical protein